MKHTYSGLYERLFKRPLDFILSLIALILLSPLLIIVAILIWIQMGWPVFFKQNRLGRNEKAFKKPCQVYLDGSDSVCRSRGSHRGTLSSAAAQGSKGDRGGISVDQRAFSGAGQPV